MNLKLECIEAKARSQRQPQSLLFVHGLYHGAWAFRTTWLPFFAAHGYDTYALSLRGHGTSEGSVNEAGFVDYLADLAQVRRNLPGPVVLIGHGSGGMLVEDYLARESAAGAVFIGTPSASDLKWERRHELINSPWSKLCAAFSKNAESFNHLRETFRAQWFNGEHSVEIELALDQIGRQSESPRYLAELRRSEDRAPIAPVPSLILCGSDDRAVSPKTLRRQADRFGGEVKVYAGRAHGLIIAPGWEDVAVDVASWLSTLPVASKVGA